MSNITTRIRTLFATEAQMAALNPVLLEGELWTEKDEETGQSTGRRKVGDGETAFDELPFEPSGGGEGGGAPDPHKTTHATGGTDALTPADIGAEVAGAAAAAQSAAIAASAPAAQGVTNGNSHDHSGGDGAQIAYSSLSGLPPLGTAAAANIGTTAGTVPVLDGAGLVPSALLPGFVDDVLEFANLAAFPVTGEAGKLYISLATNRQYRWGGSVYVEINPSPGSTDGVPEGSVNLYFTSGRGESAAASWWAASSAKTKLDGIASGATANATDAALRDRSTHTGTQAAGTITGLATVATSGAYGDLSGRPTLGTSAARDVGTTAGTVAAGDDARLSDARTPTAHTHPASAISDSTTAGRALLTAADAAAQRTTLGLATVASTGAYADLSGAPTVPGLSSSTPSALGAAAAGVAASASRADHVHPLPATVTTSAAGLQPASGYGTVSYAAQVTIDFAARDRQMATISLTGALEFLSSNLANGREVRLRLVCDSTQRALTFPTDWKFVCAKPANIAASKVAVLSLAAYGATNADVVAAYAVQP